MQQEIWGEMLGPEMTPFLPPLPTSFFLILLYYVYQTNVFPSLGPSIRTGMVIHCLILLMLRIVVIRALQLKLC